MDTVAVIRGDGIGPEIVDATLRVLEASGASLDYREALAGEAARVRFGCELPVETVRLIRELGVALKAPLHARRMSGGVTVNDNGTVRRHPSVNNGLRRELNLFVNVRPVKGWAASMDLVIMREITEDVYAGLERRIDDETAEAVKRITAGATSRLARFASEYALRMGRRRIMAVHKANVLHLTDGLFLETVRKIVAEYSALQFEEMAIDAACYNMVKRPESFDVLVLPNQYGDIVSDLAAGVAGSLGLAPGANIGEDAAVFEAAHGAAPDIAGRNLANPIGLILSAAMMLDHLGQSAAARRIRDGVDSLRSRPEYLTPDLGGRAGTRELAGALCAAVQEV
jgi:isocitrate dehydrogenase (NAD+)